MLKTDWELNHVGLVVRDWDIPMGYYQSTGMGVSVGPQIVTRDFAEHGEGEPGSYFNRGIPWLNGGSLTTRPFPSRMGPPADAKPSTYSFMDKDCQVGSLLFEVIQDETIPLEGITHLCFNVPDVKKETKALTDKGCDIVLSFTRGEDINEIYLDTRKYGHVIISFCPPVQRWERAWSAHNLSHPVLKPWTFRGLGVCVRDLDKTVEYYRDLDVADFEPEYPLDSRAVADGVLSKTVPDAAIKARLRTAQIGPVAFDFFQPLEGEAIYQESLDSRGEGVSEMSFVVDDLVKETSDLSRAGVTLAFSGKPDTGPEFACFDTRQYGGNIMVRLIQKDEEVV